MTHGTAAETGFSFVDGGPARILAVDDDPILREFAAVYLATPTTTIDTADGAEAGLAMMQETAYDILLIDIEMPGMDGIAMVGEIRSTPRWAHIPVVMVTGCEDIVSIDRAYAAGATSFVAKPVNWRLLSYHLRFVLRASGPRSLTSLPTKSPDFASAASGR
jgi:DNA-binding response OmpR family regulator